MRISVIVPAYNAGKNIGECLKSLKDQDTKHNYEIIVVDDGSTDDTEKIASKNNVELISQKNKGPATARNSGAMAAKGEIVVFIDSDCVATKNWLDEMAAPFADPKVAGVQGAYLTKQMEIVAKYVQIEIEERYERLKKHKSIDFVGSYSAAYRKSVFDEVGGFDESFPIASGEDPDLSFKISKKKYKLVFNPKAKVYHQHPTSMLEYLYTKFYRAYWRIRLYSKHKEKIISDSYTPQRLKIQIIIFYAFAISLVLGIFFRPLILISAISLLIFLISSIPFAIYASRKDFTVAILSPIFLLLRSAVFSGGLIYGFLREVLGL
ncbi:MAG: glycosyltransferase [Candidatus Diapherotrites archaeon]